MLLELFRIYLSETTGDKVSLATARKVFNLHSFRVGATCSLFHTGASLPVRQLAGRWKSQAILEYSRIMINQAIEAMTRAYTADFELYHDHHDPELEAACRAAERTDVSEQPDEDPTTPAGAGAVRIAVAEEEARDRIRHGQAPPSATPDLLGARIYLQAPCSEPGAPGAPALALVVGLHPPAHTHAVIAKLASGDLVDLTWPEFKSARRNPI